MTSKVEIILNNTPFPGAGQEIGGHGVIESMIDVEGKNWAIYLKGKLNQFQVKRALATLTRTHHALPVQDEFSLLTFQSKGMLHARTNPPGDVTVVRGHMYYARPNPISSSSFQKEMDDMLTNTPEKHFTKYTVRNTNELHERLWKGVSYAGESYGWKKGDELWHRRASFIMPKIKINKALKGATMFYHTHPSKDEPSLTSADDIQFYLDLHFAWGIKSFYTIMKHKLDHFTITAKPGGKEKYLRMSEDAFIDTVDGMIGKGEEVAKKEVGDDRPEVEFQNRITKEMVDLFNKKFKSIAKISFRPKSKNTASKLARKSNNPIAALVNPAPNPPIRVEDQYIAKALDELKGLDYAHEHYGADEYGHTMYVYWWLKHHLAPTPTQPKGRLYKLQDHGLDQESRRKLRDYLSQPIIGNYTYMDAVYLLGLYHDIAKFREKGSEQSGWEIGAEMFRNEVGPELKLPSKLTEDLAFLFDTDLGRKGIDDKDFLTQAGDYYGAAKLVQMSDMITHHPLMYTGSARKAKESGKIGMASGKQYKEYVMTELVNDLREFLDHHYVMQNPPPKVGFIKWIASYGIEDIPKEAAEELLGQFHQSVIPDSEGKTMMPGDRSSGGHLYRMRFNSTVVPGLSRYYAATFSLSSSKIVIDVGKQLGIPGDLGKGDANAIYQAVGKLLRESYPEIELEEPEPEVIVNPRHANKIQVISLSGPSAGGKSTVLKYLNKHIPDSSMPPTYTTRPKRSSDGADRVFVSKTQFKDMIERGEFVEYTISGNQHYYGRRFQDFHGSVALIEVSLSGKRHYEKRFDNLFTIYLDPDPSVTEDERAKAIFKRGGVSKEEAKRRAKKATELIAQSKKMQFDLRVIMLKGKYHEGAKKVLSEIPLVNPQTAAKVIPSPLEVVNKEREQNNLVPFTQEEFTHHTMSAAANEAQDTLIRNTREAVEWNNNQEHRLGRHPNMVPWLGTKGELLHRAPDWYNATIDQNYGLRIHEDTAQTQLPLTNPKDLFDWFEDWAKLINMKNKELKAFLDSDWGKVAGLSPQEAKKLGINSGRTSGRRILAMRKKLGLGGPKDYIKGPRHLEEMWEVALKKWTGPATKKGTDWYWCTRQVRFNKRFMGDNFGERKGPLVKKQKTQNQPSRRLLSLWVWGHDPWRYARKNGINRMPMCPDVPWVGMTEKRKYGKIEVIQGPRKNPLRKKECPLPPKKGIIVYGASWCEPCRMTKKYLDEQGKKYNYVDIEKVKGYQERIYPLTNNYRYIPVIFINGKFIGGYSELVARKNPAVKVVKDEYRSRFIDEDGNDVTSIPVSSVEFKEGVNSVNFGEPVTRAEARKPRRGNWLRVSVSAYKGKEPIIEVAPVRFWGLNESRINLRGLRANDRKFFKNIKVEGPVYPTVLSQIEEEPHAVLLVQGILSHRKEFEIRDDVTDWKGESKGRLFEVYEEGEIFMVEDKIKAFRFSPEGGKMRMDIHVWNKTRKTAENTGTITISDEGDHYFLHSIQVAPEWRGRGLVTDLIGVLFLEMPDRLPGYPKKPVRTLARVVEGMPQEKLVELLETKFGFRKLEEVDGGVLMQFDWPVDGRVIRNNPPRSKPFPWNKNRVKKSPFKTMKKAQASYDSWKKGNPIGFSASSSLKSMGKIPRASGKYELGEKYARINPMAPGYQSYGWTTQDWRSIKVNSKGDIDYSEKCGAEGTRTKNGKPRLCLPAPVIRSLMKTESGKEVLRQQARKKLRAKKGERVPWHPRIKKLHKKLEERTPEDR